MTRSGRAGEPFTIEDLAGALRGVSREAQFFVEMPDGSIRAVVGLRGGNTGEATAPSLAKGGPYRVILVSV
jgi:hypothetical protein